MIKLDVIGFPKLEQKLRTMPSSVRKEVNMEFRAWADDVARDAKANLQSKTSNTGKLAGSINPEYGDNYSAVTVSANYAAYVEFGTRKFASQYIGSLPNNWKQMANAAKGPGGGNFDQFLQSITQWMKDRGIDEKLRFPIMRKILRDGVRPQPYLYPAVIKNTIALRKRLKKILR